MDAIAQLAELERNMRSQFGTVAVRDGGSDVLRPRTPRSVATLLIVSTTAQMPAYREQAENAPGSGPGRRFAAVEREWNEASALVSRGSAEDLSSDEARAFWRALHVVAIEFAAVGLLPGWGEAYRGAVEERLQELPDEAERGLRWLADMFGDTKKLLLIGGAVVVALVVWRG